jgi:hypothetical protein
MIWKGYVAHVGEKRREEKRGEEKREEERRGEKRRDYKVLVGNHEGMKPLGRSGCRWEDVEVYLKYCIMCEDRG